MHSDAVRPSARVVVDFAASGLDLLSISGHKIVVPKGWGALLARRDATLVPLTHGGARRRKVRSGSLDVPAIRGFAVAHAHATANLASGAQRLKAYARQAHCRRTGCRLRVQVSGDWEGGDGRRVWPGNNAHLLVPGCDGDSCCSCWTPPECKCSTGSASRPGFRTQVRSSWLIGMSEHTARGALRLTLGHPRPQLTLTRSWRSAGRRLSEPRGPRWPPVPGRRFRQRRTDARRCRR